MSELARTPLYARHAAAGAKLVPFAGFEMPVAYGSILEEHRCVRTSAGLFDVSHMGEVWLRGRDATALAQRLFTNDAIELAIGRARYGMLCMPDGGVIDDVMLYRKSETQLMFCVNASNIAADVGWMREVHASSGLDVALDDESPTTGLLAVQGPEARAVCQPLFEGEAPRRFRFAEFRVAGLPALISRTGYTGEDGFEIYVSADDVVALWDRLLEAGGDRLVPVGLGARDTLRMEMGYALYGHELDREHNPLEAGLERFVAFDREFIGAEALRAARERGSERRLVALWVEGRQVARTGYTIRTSAGDGVVTSGTFGPSVERSIAIGYVPANFAAPDSEVSVVVRNREIAAVVTELPFFRRKPG